MHACMLARPSVCQPAICVHASVCACVHGCVRACVCASIRAPRLIHLDPHPAPLHLPPDPTSPHRTHPTPPCQNNAAAAPHAMLFSTGSPQVLQHRMQNSKLISPAIAQPNSAMCDAGCKTLLV